MMNRTGIIVKEMGQYSKVKLMRHTACGNCGACHLGDDQKDVHLIALNDVHGEEGDLVEVVMGTDSVLKAAFIMYIIPLAALLIGVFLGQPIFGMMNLSNIEVPSALLGLVLMVGTYLVIKKNDQKFLKSKKYTAHIEMIVQKHHKEMQPL
ncbi:SoxR reducing system RseC family protein [Fusibacter ferrireducens]|uniref:SoxR reducing system RseC family protein n=1 Tax=Fusibacter ferrireducens TaxID=2785058 RepID=A0ABR9ZUT8_9FIRM|nr:SoxR reducing system RseC family protein [Fusibacter ferrireducens]MBF4693736.1 SoxR reducing system RseC family protein [Fusibacter ferrireducens]